MSEGIVKWFDKKKGYGFVLYDDKDIFLHYSNLEEKFIPETNDLISFDIVDWEKGLKAERITRVGW